MEDRKNDNVESLAAFLHSGNEDAGSALKTEAAPSPREKSVSYPENLSDVLFSLDHKKKERSAARRTEPKPRPAPSPALEKKVPETKKAEDGVRETPYYDETEKKPVHYDNAATQMMEIGAAQKNRIRELRSEEEEEERRSRREIADMRIRYEKQRQRSRTFAFILIGAFLSVVIIGVSAYISSYIVTFALDLTGIATNDFRLDIEIPSGANVETVAAILQENNIIQSAKFFRLFADFTHKSDNFQSGTYTLSSTMSYMTIFSTLQDTSIEYKTVTIRIVEGMTASEIGKLLEENKVCYAEDFEQYYKNIQNNYDFEKRIREKSSKFNQLEGYLFPDTYEFYATLDVPELEYESKEERKKSEDEQRSRELENAESAAKKMYQNFNEKMTKQMYKQMGEMNMTLDEVITLASMVQKEAAGTEDMYYVASVFLNRIRNSEAYPNLQSDVTVLYVENEIRPYLDASSARYGRFANAYNTYVCEGIPAGPICNPGLDAIEAVLNAASTDYFYFCANKETGEVYYATTQEEHEVNLVLAGLA
ncbi:MAG: endolytic transglycosylase MltG [Bacteroides sp.]|nr:endolytic transglycosylase MltG [Eubacterium sp.]MCM1417252.1 endolytic transglycosylase MltG [Roseburia sp.]MCM1461128.1 endolytic transglycosylase MltG [Bacteroides sp.]